MGLKPIRLLASLFFLSGSLLQAAPMLRLVTTTVGPLSIAANTNGSAQTVEAYNAGDGSLNLTATPTDPATGKTVTWLLATVQPSRACTTTSLSHTCIPIVLTFNTAALPLGATTAIVTVTDPNAADAPQTITVTAQMGSSIPSSVTSYVAPNGSVSVPVTSSSLLRASSTAQWLSLIFAGQGSFNFPYPYNITLAPQPANTQGTYTGSLTISGSSFAADNKTVAVTMSVTTAPIVQPPTGSINIRQAQGAAPFGPPYTAIPLTIGSTGQQGVTFGTPTVSSGASWLTAAPSGSGATLTVDATGANLQPGPYSATVTVPSNAVNGSVTVPVNLLVLSKGAPVIAYQGVQDNATFNPGDSLTPGDVAVVKGEQLSLSAYTAGQPPPLATKVADTSVLVNGTPAPIFYTLYGQIAFQVPTTTATGTAMVQVQRTDGSTSNSVSVGIANRAPRLLLLYDGYGAIVNNDGCGAIRPCTLGGSLPFPASYSQTGYPAYPAKAGDVLTIYAIGLGATSPSVATGQPAPAVEPYARLTNTPLIRFGDNPFSPTMTPSFAALSPNFAGLYQINVQIPANAPKGTVGISAIFPDSASNIALIAIQ